MISLLSPYSLSVATILVMVMTACSSLPASLPSSGPSLEQITEPRVSGADIAVLDIDETLARRAREVRRSDSFAETMAADPPRVLSLGPGDVIEISIWEAPPAALFGVAPTDSRAALSTARQTTLPEQVIQHDGTINVPFAGSLKVAGQTLAQIELQIADRLSGKAHQPQIMVRVVRNATQNVTIVGEVLQSARMPLTAKGERVLDALAAAGGVRESVSKITLQLSRHGLVQAMPLERVIQEPQQNVYLQPGDVLTVFFQPLSFTAFGAFNKNEEINFEAKGISLAQALGRISGLRDAQADARGVFVFRFESGSVLDSKNMSSGLVDKVPVVYRIDLKDPRAFLLAQQFPVRDKDVLYVANAPGAELQKFLNILTSSVFTVNSLVNLGR